MKIAARPFSRPVLPVFFLFALGNFVGDINEIVKTLENIIKVVNVIAINNRVISN